jgi:hypothetical protein
MKQFDWVKNEAAKQRRLETLRNVIAKELQRNLPFSETSINITLLMIRQGYGIAAETETRRLFDLSEQPAA